MSTEVVDGIRVYGAGPNRPDGTREDVTKCIETVHPLGPGAGVATFYGKQCSRKHGHGPDGLYCKQHGEKVLERERLDTLNKG